MEFITTGNRIAVENFDIGKIYTITWQTGNYKSLACTGKGTDFVMFQDQEPDLLFCLTMDSAISVSSIEEGGGGAGTMNYNELENKPSINGFVLVGNKTGADLGLASQSDLEDYATNASVVAGLATKQDALSSSQLAAVNSGITSALVTQIGTNTNAIAGKQDALSSSQLAAVNSGITSALVTQIGTNTNAIAGKQDALSSSQLQAVNSGITSADVAQITTNKNNILTLSSGLKNYLSLAKVKTLNTGGTWTGNTYTYRGLTFVVNDDNTITVSGTGDGATGFIYFHLGDIYLNTSQIHACTFSTTNSSIIDTSITNLQNQEVLALDNGKVLDSFTVYTYSRIRIRTVSSLSLQSPIVVKPMLCDTAIYAISPEYEAFPKALDNLIGIMSN